MEHKIKIEVRKMLNGDVWGTVVRKTDDGHHEILTDAGEWVKIYGAHPIQKNEEIAVHPIELITEGK